VIGQGADDRHDLAEARDASTVTRRSFDSSQGLGSRLWWSSVLPAASARQALRAFSDWASRLPIDLLVQVVSASVDRPATPEQVA
jgi:hypothetical protein